MLRTLLAFVILTASASAAEDRWLSMKTDSMEMLTNADVKVARAELVHLEQFRYGLGRILGKADWTITPPALVLLFKTAAEAAVYGGDDPIQVWPEHTVFVLSPGVDPVAFHRRFAKFLIDSNTERMPADYEQGLIALFTTLEISGIRMTLGKPVPPAERDRAWARMHMLTVDPEYYAKLPVLFFNLQKGSAEDPAFRNAFGKSKAEIESELDRYMAAAIYATSSPPSKAMSAERDFHEKPLPLDGKRRQFGVIDHERELQDEYKKQMAIALEDINDNKSLTRAIEIAPKQAEPRYLLALQEWDPKKRMELLKAAIARDRRNVAYWNALGQAAVAAHDFTEAAKAWHSAEQAAATPEERGKMHKAWLDIDRQRLDYEAGDKKKLSEEEANSLRKLKEAEIASLRALEAGVNRNASQPKAGEVVVPWSTAFPTPDSKVAGILQQVDCLGKQARLTIKTDDGKIVKLLVRDPSQITLTGKGEQSLGCGRLTRKVSVEYFRKADAKMLTVGDVASIEFSE